jgi:hypothetical protein
MGDRRGAYGVLAVSPEGKGPRGTQRRIWCGNIKTDLQDVAQDRDRWRSFVMNLQAP